MESYEKYFKELLEQDKKERIFDFFIKNDIKNCAFYGFSEVARFYRTILSDRVNIDYFVENIVGKDACGIPFVRRDTKEFPETQAIIISDTINYAVIRKKLEDMNIKIPIYDVFEIIE